jgi:hypothetical protein
MRHVQRRLAGDAASLEIAQRELLRFQGPFEIGTIAEVHSVRRRHGAGKQVALGIDRANVGVASVVSQK